MFGDILEAMAGGIEAASVVIICFSQSYKVFFLLVLKKIGAFPSTFHWLIMFW